MEAVPRLPMVEFELKSSPENVDFASKIRQLIMASFGEDPASFSKEIKELETLRANSCIRVAETIDGIATLKRYFCQLSFLKSRFKVGSEGPFQFSWRDVYSGADFAVSDINYELAAVLYNLGALHTKLGGKEQRQDSEGMKMAVAHYQCAAWAFHTLPDKVPQDPESDLASELLALKSQICLAQAQECILEKSILDARKPNIVVKVCSQVVEYYRQALRHLDANGSRDDHMDSLGDIVGSKQMKSWRIFLDFKASYYSALCSLHSGMVSEESQRFGERVAHFQAASDFLVLAGKLGTKLENPYKDVGDALAYTSDVIHGKLDNAKKENEFIYHEKVPEKDSLQPVKGASLVKGIGWEVNDPEVSGPDLFSRLVPLEAHLGGSLYSEEQAKLLRTVCGEIEEANDTIAVYLASLQLEDIPGELELPQELIECCAGLSVRRNAVPQLQEAMAKLASVSSEVESSLAEIQAMLKEDEEKETEFQVVVGRRPKSIVAELERETRKYHEAHSIASESNLTLHKAMQLHVKNLKLLGSSMEEIQSRVPSLTGLEPATQDSLEDMRAIIGKVAEMRSQRAQLEGELRASVQNDDITESLARRGNKDQEKVFEEELKKHDRVVAFIKQNIAAQENIIRAMTERNAEYADARLKVDDIVRAREDMIGSLVASYHAYEDLLTKTTKGLEFYDKLEANVSKLLARVGGVVKVQEEERAAQLNSSAMKAADAHALSLRLVAGQGAPPPARGSPVPNFQPGAPPPDTPERTPPFIPPPSVTMPSTGGAPGAKSRPKLSDYLNARKETGLSKPPERLDTGGNVAPGVRPQPLGEESGPPTSSYSNIQHSAGPAFYNQAGPNFSNPGQAQQLLLQQQQLQAILGEHQQKQQQHMQHQWLPNSSPYPSSQQMTPSTSQGLRPAVQMPSSAQQSSSATPEASPQRAHPNQVVPSSAISSASPVQPLPSDQQSVATEQQPLTAAQLGQQAPTHGHLLPPSGPQQMQPGQQNFQQVQLQSRAEHPGQQSVQSGQEHPGQPPHQPRQPHPAQQVAAPPKEQLLSGGTQLPTPVYGSQSYGQHVNYGPQHQLANFHQQQPGHHQQPGQLRPEKRQQPGEQQQARYEQPREQQSGQQPPGQQPPGQQPPGQQPPGQQPPGQQPPGQQPPGQQQPGQQQYGHPQPGLQPHRLQAGQQQLQPEQQQLQPGQQKLRPGQQQVHGRQQQIHPGQQQMHPGQQQMHPGQQQMHPGQQQMHPGQQQMHPGQQQMHPGQQQMHPGQQQTHPGQQQTHPGQQQTHPGQQQMHPGQQQTHPEQQQMHPGQQQVYSTQQQVHSGQFLPKSSYQGTQEGVKSLLQQQTTPKSTFSTAQMSVSGMPKPQQQQMPQQQQVAYPQQPGQSRMSYPQQQGIHTPGQPGQSQGSYQQAAGHRPLSHEGQQQPVPTQQPPSSKTAINPIGQPGFSNQPQHDQNQQQSINPPVLQSGPMAQLQMQQQLWQHGQSLPGSFPVQWQPAVQAGSPLPVPHIQAAPPVSHMQGAAQFDSHGQAQHGPSCQPGPQQISQPGPSSQSQQTDGQSKVPVPTPGTNFALLSDISLTAPNPAVEPISPPPPSRPVVPQPGTTNTMAIIPTPSASSPASSAPKEDRTGQLRLLREKLVNVSNELGQQSFLEKQWREVLEQAEIGEKRSVSVARCYPDMNRTPDVLPFDQTRVELKDLKDDYINASKIVPFSKDGPATVVTQAPQPRYLGHFWTLVWQEGVEVLVCLVPDHDLGAGVYLPEEKEKKEVGKFIVSTFSCKRHPTYVERVVNVTKKEGGSTRALVHLQMMGWMGPDMPLSPASLVDTALAVLEQKSRATTLVHCLEGSSKSGTFLPLLWLVADMENGQISSQTWPPLVQVMAHVVRQRKGIVRGKQYIGLLYQALLHYCNVTLDKMGVSLSVTSERTRANLLTETNDQIPVQSVLKLGPDPGLQNQPSPSPSLSSISMPEMEVIDPPKNSSQENSHPNKQKKLTSLHLESQPVEPNSVAGSVPDTQGAPSPNIPSDLSKLADITLSESPKKQKITREDFLKPSTGLASKEQNSKDPLDMLDPLWSLK